MIVVVFRSRVREEALDEYYALGDKMAAIARSMPGFISYKDFMAEDGERVSVHEWETAEHLAAWRNHPEHLAAQAHGRKHFYDEYTLYVSDGPRESRFRRDSG